MKKTWGITKLIARNALLLPRCTSVRTDNFLNYINALPPSDYIIYKASIKRKNKIRAFFACKYIVGQGIEIGAQGSPLQVDRNKTTVTYVDRISNEQTTTLHNLSAQELTSINILAEADNLDMFRNESLDFVIANHLLEHIPNPVAAIEEWLRILRNNGVLYLSLPNYCCNEYDFQRRPASLDHIIDDFQNKKKDKKEEHWKEFVEIVEGFPRDSLDFSKCLHEQYRLKDNRIHMHVFNKELIDDIIEYIKANLYSNLHVIDFFSFKYSFEIIVILRKQQLTTSTSGLEILARLARNVRLLAIGK